MKNTKEKLILVINPGSTSTKTAVFIDKKCIADKNIAHTPAELNKFKNVYEQLSMRQEAVLKFIEECNISIFSLSCVVGRGGLLKPLAGGTYLVDDNMCLELKDTDKQHASNLGALLAKRIADEAGIDAFIVDPVVVDEMAPLARISGIKGIERISIFHALNQKAAARKAAAIIGKAYEECRFIVAHLGGGISVGAHQNGLVVDVNNALDGDGPFSPERAGSVPVTGLIKMCFHSGLKENEVRKRLVGNGGLVSYLGTNDARDVEKMIEDNVPEARIIFDAMAYQIAKEIGACAAVLYGKVDAIILTGGLTYSALLVRYIKERIEFLAPMMVFPGEGEMEALALGALRVLNGLEQYKRYIP